MATFGQTVRIVTKETFMCGLKGAIEIVPGGSLITRAADVVERVQQRYELLGLGDRMSEIESRLTSFDRGMRELVDKEMQKVIQGLHVPNLKGDVLDEHVRNFRAIHRHGYAPAMFEGMLRDGPHWEDLCRMPENYGDVLDSDETLNPQKVPILIGADPLRLLELTPYAFGQLLSGRPAGSSHAPRLAGVEDIWMFRDNGAGESGKELSLDLGGGVTLPLVQIPAGSFWMGSTESEEGRNANEGPQHRVTIARPFYVGKTEVTVSQFRRFVEATGYRTDAEKGGQAWEEGKKGGYLWAGSSVKWDESASWRNPGFAQTANDPVVLVSWNDAKAFCAWAARETGRPVRLPSEAEWEYACRAGTSTPFHFGATISTDQANYDGNYTYGGGKKGVYRQKTTPVGSFAANAWGLYDMHGNTWEWCEDVWHDNYNGAPTDGRAWLEGESSDAFRVLRGGSWSLNPRYCRSANRGRDRPGDRDNSPTGSGSCRGLSSLFSLIL